MTEKSKRAATICITTLLVV